MAPLYDLAVEKGTASMRQRSLSAIDTLPSPQTVLISGIGSGLDLPYLKTGPEYYGLDLTANMIKRAKRRNAELNCHLQIGNAMCLPYQSARFDIVLMHLILAVTPNPTNTLVEACRVVKPGGHVIILDKFLRRGQMAPLRRLISPFIGLLATQTNVVWETTFAQAQQQFQQHNNSGELRIQQDESDLGGGWFRRIIVQRTQ